MPAETAQHTAETADDLAEAPAWLTEMPGDRAARSSHRLAWADGDPALPVAPDLSLAGVLQPIHGATVSLENTPDDIREVLMYDISGTGLLVGRPRHAERSGQQLFLFNRADAGTYEAALRKFQYLNRSPDPTPGARRLTIEVTDATTLSTPVLDAVIEVRAHEAEAFDFLPARMLKFWPGEPQFDAFEFSRSTPFSEQPAPAEYGFADTGDQPAESTLFETGGNDYELFYAALPEPDDAPEPGRPVFADGTYLLLVHAESHPGAAVGNDGETGVLGERDYRLFRERPTGDVARSGARDLLTADPESGAMFTVTAIGRTSDSDPVIAVSDSQARRRNLFGGSGLRQAA